jgi:hypothetical protein
LLREHSRFRDRVTCLNESSRGNRSRDNDFEGSDTHSPKRGNGPALRKVQTW